MKFQQVFLLVALSSQLNLYRSVHGGNENNTAAGEGAESSLKSFLNSYSSALSSQQCYDSTWSTTAEEYVNGKWKDMLPANLPTLVYPFCADSNSMGNVLGILFNEASCAKLSGSHFIINRKPYPDFDRNLHTNGNPAAFFDALPTVILNSDPRNITAVKKYFNESNNCGCRHYCWERSAVDSAPWVKNLPWIIQVIRKAVDRWEYFCRCTGLMLGYSFSHIVSSQLFKDCRYVQGGCNRWPWQFHY